MFVLGGLYRANTFAATRDPESTVEFSDPLHGNPSLIDAFARALGDHGVFIAEMGEAADLDSATTHEFHRFVQALVETGFESIFDYTESHGRLMAARTFVIALKGSNTRARWFRNEASLQIDVHKRSRLASTEELPFQFFDGATFMGYQFPNRIAEENWCRSNKNECGDGHGFDPSLSDRKDSSYMVSKSNVGNGGRGVFMKEKIAKGSYLGIEECVNSIFVPPSTFETLEDFFSETSYATRFWATVYEGYVQGYVRRGCFVMCVSHLWFEHRVGRMDTTYVLQTHHNTLQLTANHGCNETYNIGKKPVRSMEDPNACLFRPTNWRLRT
jgi:hypothetical protein